MIYNGWDKLELNRVIEVQIDNRGKNPQEYLYKSKFPVIDNYLIKNVKHPNLNEVNRYIDKDTFENFLRGYSKKGDVIITLVGNGIGNLTTIPNDNCVILQNTLGFRCNSKMLNLFLYYYLLNNQDRIKKFDRGSSQPNIRKTDLLEMIISVPNINEQEAISNILSSLDDRIEINNKINECLEKLAQTIYKEWFVEFEFPNEVGLPYKSSSGEMVDSELGLIPKGWEVKEVIELINFIGGSQPPKKEHIYQIKEGYVRFIQNRDYDNNDNHLTYIKESKRNRQAEKEDILMDKYGQAGKVRFGIAGAYNVALAKIDTKEIDREYFRSYFLQEHIEDYILNASQASTRPSVNKTVFTNLKIAYPPNDIKEKYNKIASKYIKMNLQITEQNKKLSKTRDLLLPKLMSGEIRVPVKE